MDDWSFALLSCKIGLKTFETKDYIYKCGDESEYSYIVLIGSVLEVSACIVVLVPFFP
jgi:uncharacterized membrane protein